MQNSLTPGNYQFTVFDSAQLNLVDADINVTNNSSRINSSIVDVNLLPKTTSYQIVESNLKEYRTLKNMWIAETLRLIQEEPELTLWLDSSLQSAAQALQAPGESGFIIEDKLNDILSLTETRDNVVLKWNNALLAISKRLRNFIDNKAGMSEIASTLVLMADGTLIEVEITFKTWSSGSKAVVKVTKRAFFANGVRIPTAAFAMDDVDEITEDMIDLGAMIDYINSLGMNVAGDTAILTAPSFVSGSSKDGCIRTIDFIEDPNTGQKIAQIAKDCP
ncbi:hypothetical protein [Brumicola nitratireducens]|uniref:Uncharacterized protein n=1 Tax=Glaciecola nitratireducens (strain JCM 12485 / KCTC 12276 / FR1064) TaxID=1085623 RepID=G4QDU8_GLANF|nr:hypothetical protein [Glaciecola nitratireducens]AEP31127.1 hypothetical protein GNIT_3031 [Glaciecola nitratireducens FR1064]